MSISDCSNTTESIGSVCKLDDFCSDSKHSKCPSKGDSFCSGSDCDDCFSKSGSKPPVTAGAIGSMHDTFTKYAPCGPWSSCDTCKCEKKFKPGKNLPTRGKFEWLRTSAVKNWLLQLRTDPLDHGPREVPQCSVHPKPNTSRSSTPTTSRKTAWNANTSNRWENSDRGRFRDLVASLENPSDRVVHLDLSKVVDHSVLGLAECGRSVYVPELRIKDACRQFSMETAHVLPVTVHCIDPASLVTSPAVRQTSAMFERKNC